MLKGFEDITHELTAVEIEIAMYVSHRLNNDIRKGTPIKSDRICSLCNEHSNIHGKNWPRMTGARLRKMISVLRMTGHCARIVGTSKGYHYEESDTKLHAFIERSLRPRATKIAAVADAMLDHMSGTVEQIDLFDNTPTS